MYSVASGNSGRGRDGSGDECSGKSGSYPTKDLNNQIVTTSSRNLPKYPEWRREINRKAD